MRAVYVEKDLPRMLAVRAIKALWPNVVFSRWSPSRYADVPEPPLPSPRWVPVKNLQCGICATDLSLPFVDIDPRIAESRHFAFYVHQAETRLVRGVIDRLYKPVWHGARPTEELCFVTRYLFGGEEGGTAARQVDETSGRLPASPAPGRSSAGWMAWSEGRRPGTGGSR